VQSPAGRPTLQLHRGPTYPRRKLALTDRTLDGVSSVPRAGNKEAGPLLPLCAQKQRKESAREEREQHKRTKAEQDKADRAEKSRDKQERKNKGGLLGNL
jgi:hypothetical protein